MSQERKLRETYLGDGLYASYDGMHFILRAPRENGDHFVCLEDSVLSEFFEYIERTHGVKIAVSKAGA